MASATAENHIHPDITTKRIKTLPRLPDDVVETILLHLPPRELLRLSVLSKRFRHTWKLCRDLSFDGGFAGPAMSKHQFRSAVTFFLQHHTGTTADRFRLCYDAAGETNVVRRWIQSAIKLGIREFELDFTPSPKKFMLSANLVDVDTIKVMSLVNCELQLPFRSDGLLRHLPELTFRRMRARPVAVQAIFRNCGELASLRLINCSHVYVLKIYAQHLKGFRTLVVKDCTDVHSICLNAPAIETFHYHGKMCEFHFLSDLPCLNDVVLQIQHPRGFQLMPNVKEIISRLAFVRSLTVTSVFLEGLNNAIFSMWKLEEFHLIVAPESYINPSDVAKFLSNCPHIRCVYIDLGQNAFNGDSHHWRSHGRKYLNEYNAMFPFLQYANMKGFALKDQPLMMGRFFLRHALSLKCLVIMKAKKNSSLSDDVMISDCLKWGISSSARIEVHEFQGDKRAKIPHYLI